MSFKTYIYLVRQQMELLICLFVNYNSTYKFYNFIIISCYNFWFQFQNDKRVKKENTSLISTQFRCYNKDGAVTKVVNQRGEINFSLFFVVVV